MAHLFHRNRSVLVTAVLASALILAGCGGAAKPPSSNAGSSSAASPSASPSSSQASPSSSSPSGTLASSSANSGTSTAPTTSAAQVTFFHVASKQSFQQTVAALKKAASSQGMMELGHLNQAGVLSQAGLHLKGAEAFFIGNPAVGAKAFKMNPAVGTELPVRMYVWVNPKGTTDIGYIQPSDVLGALRPQPKGAMMNQMKMMAGKMDKAMAAIAAKAASQSTGAVTEMKGKPLQFEETMSKKAFQATMAALKQAASAQGMMELGHLNQAGALSQAGLHLKGAESFFIGNPAVGAKAFKMNPAVGLELPVRMYVWVNPKGQTQIGYIQPADMLSPLAATMKGAAMQKMNMMVQKMDQAMAAIASGAAK